MKPSKEELKAKAMKAFKELGGGTQVDPEFTTKDPEALRAGLQESFDRIFPELMKKSKHRKHVIFDEDVFQFFDGLSDSGGNFSSLINSALRSYVRDRLLKNSKEGDPAGHNKLPKSNGMVKRQISSNLYQKLINKINLLEKRVKKLENKGMSHK